MTDRELLELAAKAAGLMIHEERQAERDALIGPEKAGLCIVSVSTWWNPLTDDGDALRLAVKLGMTIEQWSEGHVYVGHRHPGNFEHERHRKDPLAATRRAIVRAAAEIGRSMK